MKHIYLKLLLSATLMAPAFLQAQVLTGTLLDENKQSLPGAAVLIEEQGIGATTDLDGKFVLQVAPGDLTVKMSFIGYTTLSRKVTVAEGQSLDMGNMAMEVATNDLDEVVVVGYGVQRRRDMTGSVVKLGSKALNDIPTPSFETALQGKAPGVQVITGSGLAGSGSLIRIRGVASISAGGDPLYVVDGIPITQEYFIQGNSGAMNSNPLAALNPNDIESVEILKDASATAIYGSRGANGVILITTKRGNSPKLKFNFSTRLGMANPTRTPEMLNGPEWLQMYKEAWTNDGKVGTPQLPAGLSWEEASRTNTNWVDQTIETGFKQRYDFGVQKATEKFNFYTGLSYDLNDSYLKGNSYERVSGRFNADWKVSSKFDIGVSTSLSRGRNNRIDAAWSGGLGAAMSTALPIFPIYDSTGAYWYNAGAGNNPVMMRELKQWRTDEYRSINNLKMNYRPIKNLTLTLSGSYDYMRIIEDVYEPWQIIGTSQNENQGNAFRTPRDVNNYNVFATATYLHRLNENSVLTYMIGAETQESKRYRYTYAYDNDQGQTIENNIYVNVPGPLFDNKELLDSLKLDNQIPEERYTFASVFGRINYSYKDKYVAQMVVRGDGSSKFGPERRWGFFPSLGVGWILSEEDWLSSSKTLNYLKLKGSFGYTGNAAFPPDQWRGNWSRNGQYNNGNILYPTVLPNEFLQWENTRSIDFGLEYGLFNDRITGELSYYNKMSDKVLINVTIPRAFGFANKWDNVAEITNQGIELVLRSRNLVGEFTWSTEFNIAYNSNEISSIGGYSPDAVSGGTNDTRVVVGSPVGTNFLVRFSHIDPSNGRPVYLDIDGNETYIWDPANRVAVGNVLPDAIGGINNSFTYKGFDFSFLFAFVIGGDIYDSSSKRQLGVMSINDGLWNMTPHIFDRWQQPGDDAGYARVTTENANLGSTTPWINTDLWLHDGSFLRLRNITFGYTFPAEKVKKWKLGGLRIYAVGTNLLTFTKFPGLDPEIARDFENATDRNMSPNITYLTPPQEKTFSLGIDLQF